MAPSTNFNTLSNLVVPIKGTFYAIEIHTKSALI